MKNVLLILVSVFFISSGTIYGQILQTNSDRFIKAVKTIKNNPDRKSIEDAISTFEDLKADSYEKSYPLVNYYEGKAYRLLGRLGGNAAKDNLLKAVNDFKTYEKFALEKKQRTEYKAAVIMLSYTYADLGNIDGDFKNAKKEINEFMENKLNSDLLDGSVTLCKADVYNADGFYKYLNRQPVLAFKEFEVSCELLKLGWPIFANNLINAGIDSFDLTGDKTYLMKAKEKYLIHWKQGYWVSNDKFRATGRLLENRLKNNAIEFPKN